MIIDVLDVRPNARCSFHELAHQREIDIVMETRILGRVHQLHREIDTLSWRICAVAGQNVLLAQDRRLAVNYKPGALVSVGNDAVADDDTLARLELHLQGHVRISPNWTRWFPIMVPPFLRAACLHRLLEQAKHVLRSL